MYQTSRGLTRPLRTAVCYRVVPHWRKPVFDRLMARDDLDVRVYYGTDIRGGKHLSVPGLEGNGWKQLRTVPLRFPSRGEVCTMPLCPTLFSELYRFRPDVLLLEGASNAPNNAFALAYAAITNTPHVWWSLGDLPGRSRSVLRRTLRGIASLGEKSADAVLSYSSVGARYFESRGISPEAIVVNPNCVDTDLEDTRRVASEAKAPEVRRSLAGPPNAPVLLFVGALTKVKAVDKLIEATRRLAAEDVPVRLLVVGDGPEREALQELAADLECVTFAGRHVDDIGAYFAAADIFVLPGLGGLAISQAMVYGLPVVSGSADGSGEDLVRNGESGILLRHGDVDELTSAVGQLVGDEEQRRRLSNGARRVIETDVNISTYMDRLVGALALAVDRSRSG